MSVDSKVPEIRFNGFSGEWAEEILGAVAEIKTGPFGSTLHAKAYIEDGHAIITTEHFKSGELPVDKKGIPQVSDDDYLRLKAYLIKVGDIVFSRVGSVDINAHVTNKQEGWLFSGRVLRVRSGKIIDSEYLHHELSTSRVKKSVVSRAVGQTMPSINTEILKITPIHFPLDTTEQTAIGNYFQKLDSLINQHQQKHDKLSNIKKAMLGKIFPKQGETIPEIRFKGFSGEWGKEKLVDVTEITMGQSPSGENYTDNPNDYILVQGNADLKNGFVVPRVWTSEVTKTATKGALIFSVRAPVGEVGKTNYDVVLGRGVAAIYGNEFVYQQLKKLKSDNYWYTVSAGSTFEAISSSELASTFIWVSSDSEQEIVGSYFQKLDALINQHQQQITKLNNIKQACLSKMFV